jgi:hypothetical protein
VRAIVEAAEREAERAREVVSGLGERADALERRLDQLVDAVHEAVEGIKAELEELRAASAPEPEPAPAVPEPEAAVDEETIAEAEAVAAREPELEPEPPATDAPEGARLLALKMALDGAPRADTARYLRENFSLEDPEALLDEVYARAGS